VPGIGEIDRAVISYAVRQVALDRVHAVEDHIAPAASAAPRRGSATARPSIWQYAHPSTQSCRVICVRAGIAWRVARLGLRLTSPATSAANRRKCRRRAPAARHRAR
jgi:hypothetical protein